MFLVAAGFKIVYPLQLARVIVYVVPFLADEPRVALGLAGVVVALEVGAGLLLLLGLAPKRSIGLAAALLAAFTGVLLVLFVRGGGPSCGCFGTGALWAGRSEIGAGVLRNLGLLCILGWLRGAQPHNNRQQAFSSVPALRGFTLIEMLVSISIIAVLMAIALPAARSARDAAKSVRRMSTSSSLLAALGQYTADYRDQHPFFGNAGSPLAPIRVRGFEMDGPFFSMHRWLWASALLPEYWDSDRTSIERHGRAEYMQESLGWPAAIVAADFQMTSTAFAVPAFWRVEPADAWRDLSYVRSTTRAMILHPARKGVIFDDLAGPTGVPDGPRMTVGLGDGSSRGVFWKQLDSSRAVSRPWGVAGLPIEATTDGLAGADF